MSDIPPSSPPPPPSMSGSPRPPVNESSDGIGAIFDMSFTRYVTPSIIKIFFIVGLVFISLAAIALFIALASVGDALGALLALIVVPVIWFMYALVLRIYAELMSLMFRMQKHLAEIERNTAATAQRPG